MTAIKISVAVITYNEEKNIKRCLESVQAIADDIVIVDSFSKDNTKNICESFGARFIEHAFEGHIQQKNWAITQAKYPHVLSLDADEALSPRLQKEILKVKENWSADGYAMNRMTNYCGKWIKHSGWYPDRKLRLWDSRKGKWGGENPHDRYIMEEGSKLKRLKGDILHYSYYNISQHIEQIHKFSSIAAQHKFEKGKNVPLFIVILRPFYQFFKTYIWKLGFLDGYFGLVLARLNVHYRFIRDIKLRELNKKKK